MGNGTTERQYNACLPLKQNGMGRTMQTPEGLIHITAGVHDIGPCSHLQTKQPVLGHRGQTLKRSEIVR